MAYEIPEGYAAQKHWRTRREDSICLAERQRDGHKVVLKTFARQFGGLERARREYEALQRVAHPRIAQALELIDYLDDPVLVLEYIPGTSAREWVRAALPSLSAVLSVAMQLAEVLRHVHERHFVHRDLTPANVIVEPSTLETHLIDLGLARTLGSAASVEQGLSVCSQPEGTLEFLSPEQTGRMNRGWDFRSDLYTFGATLYSC